jgi:hypothetical protein
VNIYKKVRNILMNYKGRNLLIIFFICAGSLLLLMLYPDRASSGPYLNSAHGNTSYGVNRSSIASFGYSIANCTHCHEQHASIGGAEPAPAGGSPSIYELFANNFSGTTTNPYAQSNDVCFYCHVDTVTGTYQDPPFSNYTYSATFGGYSSYTANVDDNIFGTFNNTSYHNLYDIYRFITGLSGSHLNFTNFPADSNPCSGCHNVHRAKRSCNKPPLTNSYDPTNSAISKPSDHNNLWGDDTGEKMNSNFTTSYQAPYWYGSTTNYEPANNTTYDGTNLPDYVTFCTDCHNTTNTISSTKLGTLKKIDWVDTGGDPSGSCTAGGDMHGKNSDTETGTNGICIKPPYNSTYSTSKCITSGLLGGVLSCTDCHEPHGAPNNFLIRKEVNGGVLSGTVGTGTSDYGYLCRQCHMDDKDYSSNSGTANHWEAVHHCAGDYPYNQSGMCGSCHGGGGGGGSVVCGGGGGGGSGRNPINCSNCHYHGSCVTNATHGSATRRTF